MPRIRWNSVRVPGFRGGHAPGSIVNNPGDYDGGETPVPIPNTAVKPVRADGTARAAWWESRSSPGFYYSPVGGPSEGRPTVDKDDRAGRPWRRGRPVGHE